MRSSRLILPSLEREARRELTEKAETHAVEVFARNLRKLLLQPPLPGKRVLAIDPGYKNGCKLAALDEFGALLAHDVIYVVGSDEQKAEARTKLGELIQRTQRQRHRHRQRHGLPADRAARGRDYWQRARRTRTCTTWS